MDIVERLRRADPESATLLCEVAADEIEWLRRVIDALEPDTRYMAQMKAERYPYEACDRMVRSIPSSPDRRK